MKLKQRYRTLNDYFGDTGASQQALADAVGVSAACISMLRTGQRFASAGLAVKIAELTGVHVASLVSPDVAALLRKAS